MGNDQHLSILQACSQDVLDSLVSCVIEIGCGFIHDQERRIVKFEQSSSEGYKLSLTLTWKVSISA